MRPLPRSVDASSPADRGDRGDPVRGRTWPFVARESEIAVGVHRMTTGAGLALFGEPGVGKTRLANRIVELTGGEDNEPDDGPFRVNLAATEARRHIPLSTLEVLLGDLRAGGRAPSLGVATELDDRLRALSGGADVLVQVDDAHLLDDTSADALATMCRLGRTRLLLTLRNEVPVPSAITALWKDEVIDRIDLEPFDLDTTALVLGAALEGQLTRSTVWTMWDATRGNPFHLRELTRDGLDDASLSVVDGVWTWRGELGPGHRIGDLVTDELARLSADEREVVELVALAEPVPVSTIRSHARPGALDAVVARGLVVLEPRSRMDPQQPRTARLQHPLYAEVVRERVGPDRRRDLFEAVVRSEQQPAEEPLPTLLRSVAWAMECDHVPALDRLLTAARAAVLLGQDEYAHHMASAVVDRIDRGDPRTIDALLIRARARRQQGDPVRAKADLEVAARLLSHLPADGGDLVGPAVAVAEARADLVQFVDDDPDEALRILDRLAADLAGHIDPSASDAWDREMTARRLTALAWAGRFDRSVDAGLESLAEPRLDTGLRLGLVAPLVLGLVARGRFDDALALAEAELPVARANPDAAPWALADIAAARFTARLCAGRIEELAGPFAGSDGSHDEVLRFDRTLQQIGSALRAAAEGRWEDAHRDLRSSAVAFESQDQRGLKANALAQLSRTAVATGRTSEARRAIADFRTTPLRAARAVGAQLRLAVLSAGVALADPGALDELKALATDAGGRGDHYIELSALHLLAVVRCGASSSDTDGGDHDGVGDGDGVHLLQRVRALDGAVDPPVGPLLVQHVEALLTGQTVLARALASSLTKAGVWLPPTDLRVDLSPRQREVAALAASGLSSREIAAQLHVSVRTVDTHLGHIFTKLGINRRSDLAAALAGLDEMART